MRNLTSGVILISRLFPSHYPSSISVSPGSMVFYQIIIKMHQRNGNRWGNLDQPHVSSNTPESERNNKQLRTDHAGKELHVIHHKGKCGRKHAFPYAANEYMQTKHSQSGWGINNTMHTCKHVQARTHTYNLQEMTRTSAYCSVRSINSSHWAASSPASMFSSVIHHVSTPLCPSPLVL